MASRAKKLETFLKKLEEDGNINSLTLKEQTKMHEDMNKEIKPLFLKARWRRAVAKKSSETRLFCR